jgi:hypothetical protein
MTGILTAVTSIVTSAVSWIGSFAGAITTSGNEILLVPVGLTVAGFGIGALRRLFNIGR